MRRCLIAALLLLSACQLTLPGREADPPVANPITQGTVTVTALDPAPAPEPVTPTAPPIAADPVAKPPPAPKSEAQITCERRNGTWSRAGRSGTMTCITMLRDSGQQCRRDRDCEGQCLARSRTCAPFSPMFGCNEVLQDDGRRVTLCID